MDVLVVCAFQDSMNALILSNLYNILSSFLLICEFIAKEGYEVSFGEF